MLKGYKTIIFGAVIAALGSIQAADLAVIITDPETAGKVMAGIGIVVMVLRKLTDTPLGKK